MESQSTSQQPAPGRQKEKPWREKERWKYLRENAKVRTAKSSDKQDFVESWYWLMVRAGELSDRFKFWYYVLTWLTTVFAATVPTLIGFTGSVDASTARILRIAAAVLGILVTGAIAVLGVVEFGNRWRLYRTYAQTLEEAGWDYLAKDDKDDRAYNDFVADVGKARRAFGRGYLDQVAVLQKPPTDTGNQTAS